MIQVSNLSKSYGEKRAIQNLNFTLEKGEVVGLLGLNGAGKTTTIRILTGYLIPTAGDAKINGKSIFDEPLEAKKKIGYLPESPPLYEEMNVRDYLIFVARIKAVPQEIFQQEIERVLSKTGITEVQDHVIGQLSLGFRKRVGIAQALVGNPDVIIMDEPISGLDPKQIIEIRNLIKDLAGEHTVLISSHILAEIYKTCDKFLFIQDGRLKKTYSLLELEDEMEKLSGLEITLSGKSKEDIESYLKSNLDSESKIEFQEEDRNGCTFLINVMNEKDFKKKIFSSLASQNLTLEYLKKQEISLEEIFMNRF
ncbi:MAG: ABC transporter ATP-binding protein [Leptospira sp.]|nr:ABC transporter ATP-binding protein [Leptospira sp.]